MTKLGRGPSPHKAEYWLPPQSKINGAEWSMPSQVFPRLPVKSISLYNHLPLLLPQWLSARP